MDDGMFPEVAVRSSRSGVSFNPASMGLVLGNSLLSGRLGRPRLRVLSMRSWVEGMARAAGLGVRLSQPGRQAELITRRLGSRAELMDVVTAMTLPMLRAFIPRTNTSKDHEPGVVIVSLDPYLTFAKMSELMRSDDATTTGIIDILTTARLLRRGLILQCKDCRRTSFVDADRVGQQYECPQCAAVNTLVSARWKEGSEPTWYYDLFAPFRDLLRDHGDVPILAATELRRRARVYADVPELEFFELDDAAERAVAEIDLIANVDGQVLVVEAKSSGRFANKTRGSQTKKILRIAQALHADRVVLATSQAEWNQTDLLHIQQEAAKLRPFAVTGSVLPDLGRAGAS